MNLVEEMKYRKIAIEMILRGARVPVVKSMSPLDMSTLTKLYKDVTGTTSPTGPLPADPNWFASSTLPWRMLQASFFAGVYESISARSPDAIAAEVLIEAYDLYVRHCHQLQREPAMNFTRCWTLMRLVKMSELELVECTCCHNRIIQPAFTLKSHFVCCLCNRSTSLKPKNWNKSDQKAA